MYILSYMKHVFFMHFWFGISQIFTHVTHSSNFPFYKVNFWSIFPLNWNIELSFFLNSDITSFICMPNMSIHFHEADCSSCLPWGFWSWLVWECPDQLATGRRGVAACHSSKWPLSEKFTQSLKKTLQSEDAKNDFVFHNNGPNCHFLCVLWEWPTFL